MGQQPIDVEQVVREVLARLGIAPQPAPALSTQRQEQTSPQPTPAATNGQLVVPHRVVTLADVVGRLDGMKRLVVTPRAVVTPSVRDELARKGVSLVHEETASVQLPDAVRLVMTILGSQFDPAGLIRALEVEGIPVQTHKLDCLIAATDLLAEEVVKPNTLGLVVSAHAAAAICLANRHQGVRAVLGIDPARVGRDAASVGANLLVVDPRANGFFQIKQMVSRFRATAPGECPEILRERLG